MASVGRSERRSERVSERASPQEWAGACCRPRPLKGEARKESVAAAGGPPAPL